MRKKPFYYQLISTTTNPCTMARPFREEARRTWLCAECGNPREQGMVNLAIQEDEPDNTPLNMVSGCTVGIARKDFLFSFGEELVRRHLYLGQVFSDERPLVGWVTFVGRHRIIVRGSTNASVRHCSGCGRNVYFAMGQLYLYPPPPVDVSIFDAGNGGLVVTEELVHQLNLNAWRKLDCTKLLVQNIPKDGLLDLKE